MCQHGQKICTTYNTEICTGCGLEMFVPMNNVVEYTECQPLLQGYSRKKRFKNILMAMFYPDTHSILSSKVCHSLLEHGRFSSVPDLMQHIKGVNCKNKHYQSMHLYAIGFVDKFTTILPPSRNTVDNLVGDFVILKRGYNSTFCDKQFFSYRWLVQKLLQKYNLTHYMQFVKFLKNKKSIALYERMYNKIMSGYSGDATPDTVLTNAI